MKYLINNFSDNDINEFSNYVKKYKYKIDNTKIDTYNNESVKFLIIVKEDLPNWFNKKFYNENHICINNKTYYEIIICKINLNGITLMIVNGEVIKIVESYMKNKKYNLAKLIDNNDKYNSLQKIIEFIKTININEIINEINTEFKKNIKFYNYNPNLLISDINFIKCLQNFDELFDNRLEWKDENKIFDQLIDKQILSNNKEQISETCYNKRICKADNNLHLFDCNTKQTNGIEICDIYDKKYKSYIHNKKGTDFRLLITQCINSYFYITDDANFKELKVNHSILENIDITIYAGIIDFVKADKYNQIKTTNDFKFKDKIIMGMAKNIIDKNNIKFKLLIIKSK